MLWWTLFVFGREGAFLGGQLQPGFLNSVSVPSLLERCRVHLWSSSMPGVAPSPLANQRIPMNISVGTLAPLALPIFSLAIPCSSSLLLAAALLRPPVHHSRHHQHHGQSQHSNAPVEPQNSAFKMPKCKQSPNHRKLIGNRQLTRTFPYSLLRLLRCLPHPRLDERAQSTQQRSQPPAQCHRLLPTCDIPHLPPPQYHSL